jgi:fatty acid desaturase
MGGFGVSPTELGAAEARVRHSDYIAKLRPLLPPDAFRPNMRAFLPIALHISIIVGVVIAVRELPHRILWAPVVLIIGNSSACLAFLAHDFAHRSVIKNRTLLYPLELVLWGFNLFPPTLWRRIHGAHHAHTNGTDDPDRRFLTSELSLSGTVAAATLYPNRYRWNVGFWLQWSVYGIRHALAALFYSGSSKPGYVTAKPLYQPGDRFWIALEIGIIAAWQITLCLFLGGAYKLIYVTVIPLAFTSAIVSWYFFTNHSLNPIDDGNDILAASTSVIVPPVFGLLHSNFCYHTEHHLFPTMNPAYYPLVSKLLQQHFPERYQRISIWRAWSMLLQNPIAATRRGDMSSDAAGDAAAGAVRRPANYSSDSYSPLHAHAEQTLK